MENGTEKRRKGLAAAVAALVMVVIFGLILFSLLCHLPGGLCLGSPGYDPGRDRCPAPAPAGAEGRRGGRGEKILMRSNGQGMRPRLKPQ